MYSFLALLQKNTDTKCTYIFRYYDDKTELMYMKSEYWNEYDRSRACDSWYNRLI